MASSVSASLRDLGERAVWKGLGDDVDAAIAANEKLRSLAPELAVLLADTLDALALIDHRTHECEGECMTTRNAVLKQIDYDPLAARAVGLVGGSEDTQG